MHGYAVVSRVPEATDIVRYGGIIDDDVARVVIGNKEDDRAVFIDVVVFDARAENGRRHRDRIGTAVEYNDSPLGDGIDKGLGAANSEGRAKLTNYNEIQKA